VEVHSLGYRTDLMLRVLEGAQVEDHRDHLVVRTPGNPAFWWGNFLLLAAPPEAGQASWWLDRFAAEFPDARHVALGVDGAGETANTDVVDQQSIHAVELVAAGLRLQLLTVMTATRVHEPPRPNRTAAYRPLTGDDDWRQSAELSAACYGDEASEWTFLQARADAARALTESGQGFWLGAFREGQLAAQLGLVGCGPGLARFQNVETHPAARREGLAGTLVYEAVRHGRQALGEGSLVMVADPADAAIRVYRSVGFAGVEAQVGFDRPPG